MPRKTKRADGRYEVKVYIGMVDGKRKYKTVYGSTQKEANQKADELKLLLNKGIDVCSNESFEEWMSHYLAMKQNTVSETQYKTIKTRADIWLKHFKKCQMSKIRTVDLQSVLNGISKKNPYTGKPSSKKTIQSYIQIMCGVFDYAIDNRAVEYNPASRLKAPNTKPPRERRALSEKERKRIIEFEHRGKPAMMLMMLSGLRRGEATALLWSDVDFKNNTISVSKSYDFKSKTIKPPKNGKSRIVTVPSILTDYLRSLPKNSIYVITSASGKQMTENAWRRLLESYLTDYNIAYGAFTEKPNKFSPNKTSLVVEPFTYHCLRHTFCTMMYEAGIDVLIAQQQMGHSSPQITLSIYTHLEKSHKQNNISKLEEYIKKSV